MTKEQIKERLTEFEQEAFDLYNKIVGFRVGRHFTKGTDLKASELFDTAEFKCFETYKHLQKARKNL